MRAVTSAIKTRTDGEARHAARKGVPHDIQFQDRNIPSADFAVFRKASCACGGGCPDCQAKSSDLKVSQPNDPAEIEADQIADKVMRMPMVETEPIGNTCSPPSTIHRTCSACEDEEKMVQRTAMPSDRGVSAQGPDHVQNAISAGGQPLDHQTRSFFEPRLGYDLSNVRIHTDSTAGQSARAIHAKAYTLGSDIIFNSGEYRPDTDNGRHLLAHELAHVAQQGSKGTRLKIKRQAAPAPSYGASCSGGATDPCQQSRCTAPIADVNADLGRAIGFVDSAITALGVSPLSSRAVRALDWYFNSHTDETAATVLARLTCTRNELQDTLTNSRFGCHPDDPLLAYVCVSQMSPCQSSHTNVCLTSKYFGKSDRVRAEVLIHECGHRAGLSAGTPDIYDHTWQFMFMDTADSLINSDSYALFAPAVTEGVRTTVYGSPYLVGLSGGAAMPSTGEATWQARLYLGTEFQNPVLGIFNPTIGIGLSLIGETTTGGRSPVTSSASFLASLVAGFRLMDARPGSAGGGYASFFGGPALAIGGSSASGNSGVELGAEAGVGIGYRWRWLDVSAGVSYAYDPTREAGMEHLLMPNLSITFAPFGFGQFPSSH
jgi:Domain of unknown function (DUF4157)